MTCVLILLIILCLFLCYIIYYVARKATYLSKKEKEFIDFTLEMYLTYGDSLDIIPKEHHDVIINELKKLKEKYFKKEE
jgi:hypothetical protein